MIPSSLPVIPAQPDLKAYATSALNLFPQFTRATFLKLFGVQAPPFDQRFPVKTWFDTSKRPSGIANYLIIQGMFQAKMQMNLAQVMAINLDGPFVYPVYTSSPLTTATIGGGQGLDGTLLSMLSDAVALSISLNGPNFPAPAEAPQEGPFITWNSELRRIWQVSAPNGGNYNANELLLDMWQYGIGAPGSWNLTNVDEPFWVPAPAVDQFAKGVVPVPTRPLKANESLQAGPAGMGIEIVRSDL